MTERQSDNVVNHTEALASLTIDPVKLKEARGERSPIKTAELLGISYQYLNLIERGQRRVPGSVLVRMCKLYGVKDILALTNQDQIFLPST